MTNPRASCMNSYRAAVYAGIKSDVEDFLWKFREKNSLAYVDFASIWQSKSFSLIYANQDQLKPLEIVCETCFFIIKKYIKLHSDLYIQIGGFFLLYGLYYKQPVENLFKIRLTLDEFKFIKTLMDRVKPDRHFDILYIYAKMISDYAFKYVVCPRSLGIINYNYFIEEYDLFINKTGSKLVEQCEQLFENQTIKDLSQICTDYDKKLQKYVKKQTDMVAFESTVIQKLKEEHENVVNKYPVVTRYHDTNPNSRTMIKKKAMSNMRAQYRGEKQVLTADFLKKKILKDEPKITMYKFIKDTLPIASNSSGLGELGLPNLSSVKDEFN